MSQEPTVRTSPTLARDNLARAAVLIAGVLALADAFRMRWLADDAFVSFAYARNLADGYGLVFNVTERVEGYTNFLWTCVLGFAFRLHAEVFQWSVWLGLAAMAATIFVLWRSARRLFPAAQAAVFPCLYTLAIYHFREFATSGLETMVFTLFTTLAAFFFTRWDGRKKAADLLALGFVLALLGLTRADGFVLIFLFVAAVAARSRASIATIAGMGRALTPVLLPVLAVLGSYYIWKLRYYGALLANTFYVRSAGRPYVSQGLVYAASYFLANGQLALLPALLARRKSERQVPPTLWAIAAGWVAYIIWVGGDFMFGRYLIPITPLASLLIADAIAARFEQRRAVRLGIQAALILVALTAPWASLQWLMPPRRLVGDLSARALVGKTLKGIIDERSSYANDGIPTMAEMARQTAEWQPLLERYDGFIAFGAAEQKQFFFTGSRKGLDLAGLTNSVLGRAPVGQRGRPGHEKVAGRLRNAYAALNKKYDPILGLFCRATDYVRLPDDAKKTGPCLSLAYWDDALADRLRKSGLTVFDFPEYLDRLLSDANSDDLRELAAQSREIEEFYFRSVHDPARWTKFQALTGSTEQPLAAR